MRKALRKLLRKALRKEAVRKVLRKEAVRKEGLRNAARRKLVVRELGRFSRPTVTGTDGNSASSTAAVAVVQSSAATFG